MCVCVCLLFSVRSWLNYMCIKWGYYHTLKQRWLKTFWLREKLVFHQLSMIINKRRCFKIIVMMPVVVNQGVKGSNINLGGTHTVMQTHNTSRWGEKRVYSPLLCHGGTNCIGQLVNDVTGTRGPGGWRGPIGRD